MPELQRDSSTLGGVAGAYRNEGNKRFVFCYVATGVALGQPRILSFSGTTTTNPLDAAPATNTSFTSFVVFPTATGANGYQWCQMRGDASVLVDGTTDVAASDFLEVINGGTALIKDGTSRSVNSVAIAQAARTTNSAGLLAVFLLGEAVQIAAS